MHISLATSQSIGFKKWSVTHKPASNDDDVIHRGVRPVAIAVPPDNEPEAVPSVPQPLGEYPCEMS